MGGVITRDGHPCRFAPLVGAFNATNISVTGGGVIDGNGAWWWKHRGDMDIEPPRLLETQYVYGLQITDIELTNSPFWTVHPYACRDVLVRRVNITANGDGQYGKNTDGIEEQKHTEGGKRQGRLPSTSERRCRVGARTGDSVPAAQVDTKWTLCGHGMVTD